MSEILILTKNILVDQKFQEKIQKLGHEVYCSTSLMEKNKISDYLLSMFSIIIFSDTVSNLEVKSILEEKNFSNRTFLRIESNHASEENKEELSELGITDFISNSVGSDELREQLSKYRESTNHISLSFSEILKMLSNKEQAVICVLKEATLPVVSRESLCKTIWNEPLNDSRKTHLSTLTRNISLKIESLTNISSPIKTVWGKGYCLCEQIRNIE